MSNKKKDILWRAYLLYLMICLAAVAIVWQIFRIQMVEGPELRKRSVELSTDMRRIEANRGNILASDGSFLAISLPLYEIRMDTRAGGLTDEAIEKELDSLAYGLSKLFGDKSTATYKQLILNGRKEKNRYLLLYKNADYNQLSLVKTLPLFRRGSNKGGLIVIQKNKRVKPYGYLAARTIGKEQDDSPGLGLETGFDEYLKGTEGLQLMEKLAGGLWRPVESDNAVDPVDGQDIHTTIDPQLQEVAENELSRQLNIHQADHGCVVLMETQTGDIKAIANLMKGKDGVYYEGYNYAIGESMEPGSTIKLATMIAALEEKVVDIYDSIPTGNGQYQLINGFTLKDSHTGGFGTVTVKHAFEVSSNIAMAKIIRKGFADDPQKFIDYLKKLKLHEPLDIPIPGEGTPRVKNRDAKDWSALSLPMMAIGYELKVTPLQVLTLYNAVANNGTMVKPRFVTHISSKGQTVKTFEPVVMSKSICSKNTLESLRAILEGVVENGTAQNLKSSLYKIAGKTGTAQIAKSKDGYKSGAKVNYLASFVGYFPADNPKYTCIVVVNSPSNSVYYGNVVAGPVFEAVATKVYASSFEINQGGFAAQIKDMSFRTPVTRKGYTSDIRDVLNMLNISHDGDREAEWAGSHNSKNKVTLVGIKPSTAQIPDLTGFGARDAVYLAEKLGVRVIIKGHGIVRKQSIVPGTAADPSQTLYLTLAP